MVGSEASTVDVADTPVHGVDVDPLTRCAHFATDRDVLAIEFACCGRFYPCFRCHARLADHEPTVWPAGDRDERALLCGACGSRFTIATYLADPLACPACDAAFNPGCLDHHDRYFEG